MAAIWEAQYDIAGQGHKRFYGTAAPSSANDTIGMVINVGDFIWNVSPSPGGPLGWQCVTAGSPGTWVSVEAISSASFTFTAAQVNAMNGTPLTLVAAQGAGTMLEVISCALENIYGSAAFSGGGAIAVYYASASGTLASSTAAATFLTSPTANQIALLTPAVASALASTVVNQPLVLSNASGAFSVGTGGSLTVRLRYRTHIGLS